MVKSTAEKYWARLRTNVSRYVPYLAHYSNTFYNTPLFDIDAMLWIAERTWPQEIGPEGEPTGSDWHIGLPTVRLLVVAAVTAGYPQICLPFDDYSKCGRLLSLPGRNRWLCEDWSRVLGSGWSLFGALASLHEAAFHKTVYHPRCEDALEEEITFEAALHEALHKDDFVPPGLSRRLLALAPGAGKGTARRTPRCAQHGTLLRAAAHLSLADQLRWPRVLRSKSRDAKDDREQEQDALDEQAAIQAKIDTELRLAQALLRGTLKAHCGERANRTKDSKGDVLQVGMLSRIPHGLWRLLDRLQCQTEASVATRRGRIINGASNSLMRSDIDVSYRLAVFPYRELVSDFVRGHGVPYCNEGVLLILQRLARRMEMHGAKALRIVEVGANLGDCTLWAAQRFRSMRSLEHLEVVAYEASHSAAALLERSVSLNGLEHVVQVTHAAVVGPQALSRSGPVLRLRSKPRSQNSFAPVPCNESKVSAVEMADAGHVLIESSAVTLDSSLSHHKRLAAQRSRRRWENVDLLMAHISGGELDVLRGARRLLGLIPQKGFTRTLFRTRARAPLAVLLQVYGPNVGLNLPCNYAAERVASWLRARGFTVRPIAFPGVGGGWRRAMSLQSPGSLLRYMKTYGGGLACMPNLLAVPRWSRLVV